MAGNTFNTGKYVNGIFQDASNNIGIGAAPSGSYKLEVTGSAKVSTTLLVSGAATVGGNLGIAGRVPRSGAGVTTIESTNYVIEDNGGFGFKSNVYYNGSNNIYINNGQATRLSSTGGGYTFYTAPTGTAGSIATFSYVFDITNTGAATFSSTLGCSGAFIQLNQTELFPSSGGSNKAFAFQLSSVVSGDFAISSGSTSSGGTYTPRLYINPSGNVGIGTSSVNYKFDVLGSASDWAGHFKSSAGSQPDVYICDGSANSGIFINTRNTSGSYNAFLVSNGTTELFKVRNDGLIYTGTAASSPYNYGGGSSVLYVGSVGQLGVNSSTRESKTNIVYLNDVSWLLSLKPASFNKWERDENNNFTDQYEPITNYGLIADEVEEIKSDFVFYDKDNKLAGVHYDRLIAPILKLVQEQQATITSLQDRLTKAGL